MKKEVIAVDLGGTNLRVALVADDKIVRLIRKETPDSKKELLDDLCESISELNNGNIKGIGIGAPGPLKNGVILNPPNIPLKNFNLKEFIRKKFNVKVEVENDAKCVALAEHKLGLGKGKKNFFVLTLGTGIGGGVIIDGKLYNSRDIGGELGSICLDNGKKFEELAGWKAVSELTKQEFGNELYVSELVKMNNSKSNKVLDEISEYMGQGIGSLINIFNPEILILAGGMRNGGEKFLDILKSKAKKYIFLPAEYKIVWSKLDEPGIIGAGLLV